MRRLSRALVVTGVASALTACASSNVGTASTSAPGQIPSSTETLEQRVDRLERDLANLRIGLFSGAPVDGTHRVGRKRH